MRALLGRRTGRVGFSEDDVYGYEPAASPSYTENKGGVTERDRIDYALHHAFARRGENMPPEPLTDEQRKALFAKLKRGELSDR